MGNRVLSSVAIDFTDRLLGVSVNAVLWTVYVLGVSTQARTMRDAYDAFQSVDDAFERVNYNTFKRAFQSLISDGYVSKKRKRTFEDVAITEEGRKKLSTFLPQYRQKRTWNGYIYLISYDIEEKHRKKRDKLRLFLRQIGCGLLQESLWVTPYNPTDLVEEFVSGEHVLGTILVSKLGKDGAIGEGDISKLLEGVYHLSRVNEQYKQLLGDINGKKRPLFQLVTTFYSILKGDPQLPFALLPKDWSGDTVYRLLQEYL